MFPQHLIGFAKNKSNTVHLYKQNILLIEKKDPRALDPV